MRLLLLLLRTSRWDAVTGIVAGAAVGLSASGFAWVLQATIAHRGENWLAYTLAFVGFWLTYGLGSVLAGNRITRVAQRAVRDLRLSISRRILALPLTVLEKDQARIFPVLTEDIAMISSATSRLPSAISGCATVLGCFVLLTVIAWPLALACLVLLIVAVGLYVQPLRRFQRHLAVWRADWDRFARLLDAIVHGHKELILDQRKRTAFLEQQLEPIARRQEREMTGANTWEILIRRWGELLMLLGLGLLLFTLPWHAWATYDQFGRFLFVALFILSPLTTLVGFSTDLGRARLAINRINDVGGLLEQHAGPPPPPVTSAPVGFRHLALREVSYRHAGKEGAAFTLGPVSVAFDRPEVVLISGGNGSGKTTLLKVMCGLYPADKGEITLDGRPLAAATLEEHRASFAVVFSDFFLFPSLLGYEQSPAAARDRLLCDMQLDRQVQVNADGEFSTTKLSQGQRKRLALVAALLEDKPVYVFDEWAADQDPGFRRLFYERILPGLRDRGKLVLAISHDEAYYPLADRHLHLVDGHITGDTRPVTI